MGEAKNIYFTCLNEAPLRERLHCSELVSELKTHYIERPDKTGFCPPLKMWYEVLPSMGLVGGFLLAPQIFNYCWNRITLNWHNEIRRWDYDETIYNRDFYQYVRDHRMTGSEYKMRGLEAQPDPKEDCQCE